MKNCGDEEEKHVLIYLAQCICIWSKNFDFCVFLLLYVFGIKKVIDDGRIFNGLISE